MGDYGDGRCAPNPKDNLLSQVNIGSKLWTIPARDTVKTVTQGGESCIRISLQPRTVDIYTPLTLDREQRTA